MLCKLDYEDKTNCTQSEKRLEVKEDQKRKKRKKKSR